MAVPPRIDGVLDDDAWQGAAQTGGFVQRSPLEGEAATDPTEIYLAFDGDSLYVGIRAHYAAPSAIRANRVDRDQIWRDDTVRVYLDPFLDQQRAYVFAVNAFGIQGDALLAPGWDIGGS